MNGRDSSVTPLTYLEDEVRHFKHKLENGDIDEIEVEKAQQVLESLNNLTTYLFIPFT